jgi:nucleoside-diphosphate-sugar epimerase
MNVLVTGASGFVGQHFVDTYSKLHQITTVSLQSQNWQNNSFYGIDTIVHLAGKAHQMTPIEDAIYFEVNFELTKQLFEKAVAEGVKHFIYISSTKVYGDGNYENLNENSNCEPTDAYGKSKLQAEQYLINQNSISVAIVRPPLVYGKGVKGNMQKLIALCKKRKWLPFGNIHNKRSMVYVGNLVALINQIIDKKANGVFVAGDATAVSTSHLVKTISNKLGSSNKLITIPLFLRAIIKTLKPALYIRLFGSFYVDNATTNRMLNFEPPFTFEQGIQIMVDNK